MNKKRLSDRYEIKEQIGRGGMGEVYHAWDPKTCRKVAIKVLRPEHLGKLSYLERFEREGRAMGQLAHDNIVRLFDVGNDGEDHYIVMEYFPAKNLATLLFEHPPFCEKEVLEIALQIAEGLSYAHSKGIIHRDIKPGNIMMDERGHVKITDFGIAKIDEAKLSLGTSLTALGAVIGTQKYMSPEQAQAVEIDGQSDLYSLGLVLSELLTGETGHQPDHETVKLGIQNPTKNVHPKISIPVQNLLKALLQKERRLRVDDATTLIEMIKALLETTPQGFAPPKTLSFSLVLILILITIGSVYFISDNTFWAKESHLNTKKMPPPEMEQRQLAEEQAAKNKRLAEETAQHLAEEKKRAALARKEQDEIKQRRITEEKAAENKRLAEQKAQRLEKEKKQAALAHKKQRELEQRRILEEQATQKKRLAEEIVQLLEEEKERAALARKKELEMDQKRIAKALAAENKRLTEVIAQRVADDKKQADLAQKASDLRILNRRLSLFETVYENKALSQLQTISRLSPETTQLLGRIFETYTAVDISLSQLSLVGDVAKFVVSIDSLTKTNGGRSYASSRWKEKTVIIRKTKDHWGKFEW